MSKKNRKKKSKLKINNNNSYTELLRQTGTKTIERFHKDSFMLSFQKRMINAMEVLKEDIENKKEEMAELVKNIKFNQVKPEYISQIEHIVEQKINKAKAEVVIKEILNENSISTNYINKGEILHLMSKITTVKEEIRDGSKVKEDNN